MASGLSRETRPCAWRIFSGTSAEFWLKLQSLYELRLAQQKSGKAISRLPTRKDGVSRFRLQSQQRLAARVCT
jgi:plasmid maintenance system antidote protein VapI